MKCRGFCFVKRIFTLYFIESSKPNPNQITTSNGKPGAVNGAVGTTFQPQNPLLGRACESCYGKFSPAGWPIVGEGGDLCCLCGVGGMEVKQVSNHTEFTITQFQSEKVPILPFCLDKI